MRKVDEEFLRAENDLGLDEMVSSELKMLHVKQVPSNASELPAEEFMIAASGLDPENQYSGICKGDR